MERRDQSQARYGPGSTRSRLLALGALCWLLVATSGAWALDTDDGQTASTSGTLLGHESLAVVGSGQTGLGATEDTLKAAPLLGNLQLAFGRSSQVQLNAFTYLGKGPAQTLSLSPALGLLGGVPQGPMGRSLGLTGRPQTQAPGDQATSLKLAYGNGRAKVAVDFSDVGANFPQAATALQGTDQAAVEALKAQAGLRTMNLNGSLQLAPQLNLSTTHTSVYNDKPGDEKRGLTTTDWANALALSMGPRTNLKLNLTDHTESWDPTTGKTGLSRRTSQLAWDTAFGRGGANSLKFGLTDTRTEQGGQEQSERVQELHLGLAPYTRLKLSADQVAKEDAQGKTQTTNAVGAVMQLAAGAELTTTLTTVSPEGGADVRARYLKLTSGLGAGASALKLFAEQRLTQTEGSGALEEAKYELTGGLGAGAGKLNLHGLFQQKQGAGADGALELLTQFHLDRAFGPRLTLAADHEATAKGTNAQPNAAAKTVVNLTATLDPSTKLTASLGTASVGTAAPRAMRDVVLERRVAQMVMRAEEHERPSKEQTSSRTFGADLPMGQVPQWATDISRRHEFGDIYDYMVPKEAGWLDTPFAGLRYARTSRHNGPDAGVNTTVVSYRTTLAQRCHLQVTYHTRPEYEDGDQKGRPTDLNRRYFSLGAPVTPGLVARSWLTLEDKITDPLSSRSSWGLGVLGKVSGDGQLEINYAQDRGQWEGQMVERDSLAVLYAHKVNEENRIALKLGYAWGGSAANGRSSDCRIGVQYNKPV